MAGAALTCASLVCIGLWVNLMGGGVTLMPSLHLATNISTQWNVFHCGMLFTAALFAVIPCFIETHRTLSLILVAFIMTAHRELIGLILPDDPLTASMAVSFIGVLSYLWYVMSIYLSIARVFDLRGCILLITVAQIAEQLVSAYATALLPLAAKLVLLFVLPLFALGAYLYAQKFLGSPVRSPTGNPLRSPAKTLARQKATKGAADAGDETLLHGAAERYLLTVLVVACIASVALSASTSTGVWGGLAIERLGEAVLGTSTGVWSGLYTQEPGFIVMTINTLVSCLILAGLSFLSLVSTTREPLSSRYQISLLVIVAGFFLLVVGDILFPEGMPSGFYLVFTGVESYSHVLMWTILLTAVQRLRFPAYRIAALGLGVYGVCSLLWYVLLFGIDSAVKATILVIAFFAVVVVAVHPRLLGLFGRVRSTMTSAEGLNEYTLPGEPEVPLEVSGRAVAATLRRRCELMAETYRLTPRETDILFRLAQGRSQPQIQRLLVLSGGTIKTHIAHIYEKMGVHSNQEILDLVFDESG